MTITMRLGFLTRNLSRSIFCNVVNTIPTAVHLGLPPCLINYENITLTSIFDADEPPKHDPATFASLVRYLLEVTSAFPVTTSEQRASTITNGKLNVVCLKVFSHILDRHNARASTKSKALQQPPTEIDDGPRSCLRIILRFQYR